MCSEFVSVSIHPLVNSANSLVAAAAAMALVIQQQLHFREGISKRTGVPKHTWIHVK